MKELAGINQICSEAAAVALMQGLVDPWSFIKAFCGLL